MPEQYWNDNVFPLIGYHANIVFFVQSLSNTLLYLKLSANLKTYKELLVYKTVERKLEPLPLKEKIENVFRFLFSFNMKQPESELRKFFLRS